MNNSQNRLGLLSHYWHPVAIFDHSGLLLETNSSWEKTFGWSAETRPGAEWQKWILEIDRPLVIKTFENRIRQHEQLRVRYQDGQKIQMVDLEMTFVPENNLAFVIAKNSALTDQQSHSGFRHTIRTEDGFISGYLEIAQDLTAMREMEKMLERHRQTMIASAKMVSLGQMAAAVAHEINNPLAVILGRMHLLSSKLGAANTPAIQEHIDIVNRQSDRISKIIQGLRIFSRHSSDDSFSLIKITKLLDDVKTLSETKLKGNGVDLKIELQDAKLEIECRPAEIAQVVFSLISNSFDAIEALPERWVHLQIEDQNNQILISVTDSGRGISEKTATRIFDPFFTTKEVGKGIGLGLNIAHGIVAKHGGEIKIDHDCKNTRFVVRLPKNHRLQKAA